MTAARRLSLYQPAYTRHYGPHYHRILQAFRAAGDSGLTDHELSFSLSISSANARGRRGHLSKWGYVENSSTTRKSPSGVSSIVWRITPQGIAQLLNFTTET